MLLFEDTEMQAARRREQPGVPYEGSSLEFRTELYNALNHPQFANPDNDFASPTFGVIRSTSVSSRVIQLALKFAF